MRSTFRKIVLAFFIFALGFCVIPRLHAQAPLIQKDYEEDFDVFWKETAESYAYFDRKQTDWDKVKEVYRPRIAGVTSIGSFITLLEQATDELYDFHYNLNTNTAASAVLVPTDADLWAEWRGGRAIITEVRANSPAHKAGIQAGTEVVSIDGVAIRAAVQRRMGQCLKKPDVAADNWALRTLLAGTHDKKRQIEIASKSGRATFVLDTAHIDSESLLESRAAGARGEIGYIRLHNSLGDDRLIAEFDRALESLKQTRGMILDLRDTPSGGNTVVGRAILGRFISKEAFYQKHSIPAEERVYGVKRSWVEIVSPRGPFCYDRPLVVLVDHWTGSMGEGVAIGFDAMKRAHIVGTEMARLLGATEPVVLPHTKISVHLPTEKLFQPSGKPREDFVPPVYVDFLKLPQGSGSDPIFDQGMKALVP